MNTHRFPIAPPLADGWQQLELTTNFDDGHNPREHWLDNDPRIQHINSRMYKPQGELYVAMLCSDGYLLELSGPVWVIRFARDILPTPQLPSGTYHFRESFRRRVQWAQLCADSPTPITRTEALAMGSAGLRRFLRDCQLPTWRHFDALARVRARAESLNCRVP
jgi:hypothetical protein